MKFSYQIKNALKAGDIKFLRTCINEKNVSAIDEKGRTLLHYAVRYGNEDAAIFLLKNGANIDALTKEHETPLSWAAYYQNIKIAQLLLIYRANRDILDNYGNKPIDIARTDELKNLLRPLGEIDTDNLSPSDVDILFVTPSNLIKIIGDSFQD